MSAVKRSAALSPPAIAVRSRSSALDGFRGLAVLLMLLDHLVLVLDGPFVLRATLGRLALPAFFLLAGHLARRPRWRHAGIAAIGIALPVVVPWIDSPNVLAWWGLGVLILWLCGEAGVPSWVFALLALTFLANGWSPTPATGASYDPYALFGMMALGTLVPRSAFAWGRHLPGWVASIGRHPIAWYVGHLLALQGFLLLTR